MNGMQRTGTCHNAPVRARHDRRDFSYPIRFATAITIPVTNVARQENSRRSLKIIDMRRAPRSLPVQAQVASLRACCRSGSRLLITCKLERFTRAPLSDHTTARSRRTSGRQGGAPATQTSITGALCFWFLRIDSPSPQAEAAGVRLAHSANK